MLKSHVKTNKLRSLDYDVNNAFNKGNNPDYGRCMSPQSSHGQNSLIIIWNEKLILFKM